MPTKGKNIMSGGRLPPEIRDRFDAMLRSRGWEYKDAVNYLLEKCESVSAADALIALTKKKAALEKEITKLDRELWKIDDGEVKAVTEIQQKVVAENPTLSQEAKQSRFVKATIGLNSEVVTNLLQIWQAKLKLREVTTQMSNIRDAKTEPDAAKASVAQEGQ